ncbi:hypothetical protein MKW94_025028, partial [Papaver nudicaule]|nr:hypothetical protein [Papaver nudicaule]
MNLTSLQLLQQFYGEEKSAMDLDCEASDRRSEASHDTEAFHQEESCQQERDEDASSMSSVDYHYSEEDIDEYDDDDDDDDGDEREV